MTALDRVFIQPDIRRRRLTVNVTAGEPGAIRLRIDGTDRATEVCSEGGGPVRALLDFPEFDCWSPEEPVLYTLMAEFPRNGGGVETVPARFGMREFTVKERRFALNNRPYAVRGASLPVTAGGIADGSAAAVLKTAGFNLVRVRGDSLPETLLTACDELGLLVWFEPAPAAPLPRALIPHLNHPSLTAVTLPAFDKDAQASVEAIRGEDPSRVLFLPPSQDRGTPSRLVRPYHDTPEPCDLLALGNPGPVPRTVELHCQHNGSPDRLVMFGEAGSRGLPCGAQGAERAFHARGLESVFGTPERFEQALTAFQAHALQVQLDAMRVNAKSAGYCLELPATLPTEPETSELRQTLRMTQTPLRMAVECDRTNIRPRDEIRVRVSLVNDRRVEGRADLSIQVVGPTKQVLWKKRRTVRITKAGGELWTGSLAASGSPGEHRIVARLMQGMNRVAETSVPLFVSADPVSSPVAVMMPPVYPQAPAVHPLLQEAEERAPVHILPRLANTVRAYPAEFVSDMLGEIAAGAVGIVFSPPDDWNDLAGASDGPDTLSISPVKLSSGCGGVYHYAKRHPVFEDLPARGLMGWAYRNVLPHTAFMDDGEQDIAGCLDGGAPEDGDGGEAAMPWRSDILVKRHGEGRIVFTHFRLLEHFEEDPVAARMLVNFVSHFSSRAVPADEAPPSDRGVLRWLTRQQESVRRWMVLGMFPNFGEAGHDTAYPPEETIDLKAVYPGWFTAIGWRRWHSVQSEEHVLDLAAATAPGGMPYTQDDYGTAYAYAELSHPHREAVYIHLAERNAIKCWLNGRLVYETRGDPAATPRNPARVPATLRQGKNTVLLKLSKSPGPALASVDFEAQDGRPLNLHWWR